MRSVACRPVARSTFSGEHQDGDLLVVSEFTNGGIVSTINVYRWDGRIDDRSRLAEPDADRRSASTAGPAPLWHACDDRDLR